MIRAACRFAAVIVVMAGAASVLAGEASGRITAGPVQAQRWSVERANEWYEQQGWLVGCNFAPSTAINQLEMWQADTFDPATIDRELGWAQDLGFNSMRVFLHDLLWKQDAEGFLERMEQFLEIADRHKIGVMFVLFDGVWDPFPHAGRQREPKPHVHNSGWVQSPGVEILRDPPATRSCKATSRASSATSARTGACTRGTCSTSRTTSTGPPTGNRSRRTRRTWRWRC